MKILLDENLPHRLRLALPGHDVTTVAYLGWAGVKNGELLRLAEDSGFQVFLTADRNLNDQQNLQRRPISVVCLTSLDWEIIRPHVDAVNVAVKASLPGSFQVVQRGEFRRG